MNIFKHIQPCNPSSALLLQRTDDQLPQPHPLPAPDGAHFSLILGISLGLLASFIQSLGLTIQRKSHLQNERLPIHSRKPDYARPVWLMGFLIYLSFNVLGSIFQIGTLPLIILGPLGAISLLWNAILARLLLGDLFSFHLITGTILIGLGALLIGLNGVLPDQSSSHDLDELIYLYFRTPFLIEIILLVSTLSIVCSFAHLYEFRLNQSLETISLLTISPTPSPPDLSNQSIKLDHQNLPHHHPLPRHPQLPPSNHHPTGPLEDQIDHQEALNHSRHSINLTSRPLSPPSIKKRPKRANHHHYPTYRARSINSPAHHPLSLSFPHQPIDTIDSDIPLTPPIIHRQSRHTPKQSKLNNSSHLAHSVTKHEPVVVEDLPSSQKIKRFKLLVGIAYGSTSGILSGICLLFAKTGVELLIRTLTGTVNEFYKFQTWVILLVLLISALLQLWYLNRALRLVNPTLICPLAFCFYNLSSIVSSLVYYDQFKLLSAFQVMAISVGTVILLGGVWVVSIGTHNSSKAESLLSQEEREQEGRIGAEGIDNRSNCSGSGVDEDEVTPLLSSSSRIEDLDDDECFSADPLDDSLEAGQTDEGPLRIDCQQAFLPHPDSSSSTQSPYPGRKSSSHPFDQLVRQFIVEGEVTPLRGFSIGLGAASPGFAIRPKRRRKTADSVRQRPSFNINRLDPDYWQSMDDQSEPSAGTPTVPTLTPPEADSDTRENGVVPEGEEQGEQSSTLRDGD